MKLSAPFAAPPEQGWNWQSLYDSYAALPACFYAASPPAAHPSPKCLVYNESLAQDLGLAGAWDKALEAALREPQPLLSMAYAGHQFGAFTMLGDGRAHLLGEHLTPDGKIYDIQFKGSGATPFSRGGDGRAALSPMLREYIISEAMAALKIPTTRSLAVLASGDAVARERVEQGAVLVRAATSHLRIGTFEYAAATQDKDNIKAIFNYTCARHKIETDPQEFLREIMRRQIALIINWLRVGFIHGVMNSDNTSISGETIDYGPCAFLDEYNAAKVFSSIDEGGRYAFANQPAMLKWNLTRLAESLLPLLNDDTDKAVAKAEAVLAEFAPQFQTAYLDMMRAKLGLTSPAPNDAALINEMLELMQKHQADYTNWFLDLQNPTARAPEYNDWWQKYLARRAQDKNAEAAHSLMAKTNPQIIPRNHQVAAALAAAETGDFTATHKLLAALQNPYSADPQFDSYKTPPSEAEKIRYTFCGT